MTARAGRAEMPLTKAMIERSNLRVANKFDGTPQARDWKTSGTPESKKSSLTGSRTRAFRVRGEYHSR
jgi:hypothetical protein